MSCSSSLLLSWRRRELHFISILAVLLTFRPTTWRSWCHYTGAGFYHSSRMLQRTFCARIWPLPRKKSWGKDLGVEPFLFWAPFLWNFIQNLVPSFWLLRVYSFFLNISSFFICWFFVDPPPRGESSSQEPVSHFKKEPVTLPLRRRGSRPVIKVLVPEKQGNKTTF